MDIKQKQEETSVVNASSSHQGSHPDNLEIYASHIDACNGFPVEIPELCIGIEEADGCIACIWDWVFTSLTKSPTHNAVFDNRYMKLFDARPNGIKTPKYEVVLHHASAILHTLSF